MTSTVLTEDHDFRANTADFLRSRLNIRPWVPQETADGFRLFGPASHGLNGHDLARPLRVCVATSVRDIGCDDRANRVIEVGGTPVFMQGSLHALLDATAQELRGVVEVVGIVVDDIPERQDRAELNQHGEDYTAIPDESDRWIVPRGYALPDGRPLLEIVTNIPSDFRALPRRTTAHLATREREKCRFERELGSFADEVGADVILSDHLMVKLEHLFREGPYASRVVNIHPAITWELDSNRLRGRSPTRDAIERAQTTGYGLTGASFHFISPELDEGPVICDRERTRVSPADEVATLRFRNYREAKIPVLIRGLEYLARNFNELVANRPDLNTIF